MYCEGPALDAEAHALIMTDAGKSMLSFEYKKPHLHMRAVGSQIGPWLARLHTSTIGESEKIYHNTFWDKVTPMQGPILAKNLTDKHGIAPELMQHTIPVASREQAGGPKCVVQGDFRPGNILVRILGASQSDIAVVDWELTRLATGTSDVIQFATEAYVLEYIHGKGASGVISQGISRGCWGFGQRGVCHFGGTPIWCFHANMDVSP